MRAVARGHRSATSSSSTARAAPTPASTRSRRSRTSTSPRRCRRQTLRQRLNDELPADINILRDRHRCRTVSTRATTRASRSYVYQIARRRTAFAKPFVWWVKERARRRRDAARRPRASSAFADFASFTDDDPEEKSTTVLVERVEHRGGRRPHRWSASRDRTSSGRWSAAWSACSSRSARGS